MKTESIFRISIVIITVLTMLLSLSVNADWENDSQSGISMPAFGEINQDIVVILTSSPNNNPEAACLAVTFARMASMGANVTLFPILDGVALADKKVVAGKRLRHYRCSVPVNMDPDGEVSLKEHLESFLNSNSYNMVVCPFCWIERYGDIDPYYGYLPPSCTGPGTPDGCMAVYKMTMDADKVVNF